MNIADKIAAALAASVQSAHRLSIRPSAEREFFAGGTNGPHGALETPIRNTCHWIVALLRAWRIAGENSCLEQAMRLRRWLLDPANPFNRYPTFVMRSVRRQDAVNGVIGAAWLLEAMHELATVTDDDVARQRGRDLLAAHVLSPWGAWRRFDPVTGNRSVDYTYDHQAWFAAAAADWSGQASGAIRAFLDALADGAFRTHCDGRIMHLYHCRAPKALLLKAIYDCKERACAGFQAEIECGYQLYSLYPLARLKRHFHDHPLFAAQPFKRALAYCTRERILALKANRFGYAYNAPGLELPMVFGAFRQDLPLQPQDVVTVMDDQASHTTDRETGLNTRNTPDPLTLSARIYELALALDVAVPDESSQQHTARLACAG